MRPEEARPLLDFALQSAAEVVLGKPETLRLALCCLLARGHLLVEDVPGVGKTLLAQTLARLLGLGFQRIQFTSDLLPADVVGVSVWDRAAGGFRFHPGPVFAQVVLADEINRATPKAQSALLEAMEERQVTVEGETRPLPSPFFVVATQNPIHQVGTFPLPESQLDRFLMRLALGYPGPDAERALLRGRDRRDVLRDLPPRLTAADLEAAQAAVLEVHVSEPLLDYLQALLAHTRSSGAFRQGLSPRGGLALLRAAQAWALFEGRGFVVPEDVQAVLPAVAGHRVLGDAERHGLGAREALAELARAVPVP